VQIIGVSFDDPATNLAWAQAEGFGYGLWSDEDRELALYYGAATSPNQAFASRVTVLLDEQGELLLEYPSVLTGTHPGEVLSDCLALWGGTP
jgi:peroxiredoxin